MSSENRIRAGELYSRDDITESLKCGEWLIDVLIELYGLTQLGGKIKWFEGADVIAALGRHARHDVVQTITAGPRTKNELLRLCRQRKKANGEKETTS